MKKYEIISHNKYYKPSKSRRKYIQVSDNYFVLGHGGQYIYSKDGKLSGYYVKPGLIMFQHF